MHQNIKQNLNLKTNQSQRLLLSISMQQALDVLQMPVFELSEWLKQQIEQNPILELDFPSSQEKETFEILCSIEQESGLCRESSDPTSLE
ncbi:MAG: hypothetical protein HYZ48_02000, partial [Chlamydiales bacterium]|nr:hypothetical protein [Chlamydiales bacterium]